MGFIVFIVSFFPIHHPFASCRSTSPAFCQGRYRKGETGGKSLSVKLPIINDFKDADGNDCMKQTIQDNYNQIKEDVKQIVKDELGRIANDENLKHLIQKA